MPTPYLYAPMLRPAGTCALPPGVDWEYTEVPGFLAHKRTDLPRSRRAYGVIRTSRALTLAELNHFDLMPVVPVETDAYDPPDELLTDAERWLDAARESWPNGDGETFAHCLACDTVDGHEDGCPVPVLRAWLRRG